MAGDEAKEAEAAKVIQNVFRSSRPSEAEAGRQLSEQEHRGQPSSAAGNPRRGPAGSQEKADASANKVTSDDRWLDTLERTKLQQATISAASGENDTAADRWRRGGIFAREIGGKTSPGPGDSAAPPASGDAHDSGEQGLLRTNTGALRARIQAARTYAQYRDPDTGKRKPFNGQKGGSKAVKVKKKLEEQHWLEMIDTKHRYGSNLKYYFEEWQSSAETKANFFHWLDHGEGKDLSLPKCSREKLERERILYLSVEQRESYLVRVDKKSGKFRWANPRPEAVEATHDSHPLVDTTGRKWTDLGDGKGLAPTGAVIKDGSQAESASDDEAGTMIDSDDSASDSSFDRDDDSSDSSASSASSVSITRPSSLRRTSSASVTNEKAGKQEKEKGDVWIYVSDAQYRLYLGIKQKGRFQHSSFLAGGPITSAGTLVIRDGQLLKCNPMSGHYRTKSVYFRRWIDEMESRGADLSQVKIKGTELKLWFVERANTLHAWKGKLRRAKKMVDKKINK